MEIEKPKYGIAVDGFCSGNPGYGGYRGVDISTGKQLFKRTYPYTTNNLVEFLGICHALGFNKKLSKSEHDEYPVIYSDSVCALQWLKDQKVSSGINLVKGKDVMDDVHKSLKWLSEQKRLTMVLKWETKIWGEIPADFNNKK